MAVPGDIAAPAVGVLTIAGLGWAWTRRRATQAGDPSIRAVYQGRFAKVWANVVFGVIAVAAAVALVAAVIMALD